MGLLHFSVYENKRQKLVKQLLEELAKIPQLKIDAQQIHAALLGPVADKIQLAADEIHEILSKECPLRTTEERALVINDYAFGALRKTLTGALHLNQFKLHKDQWQALYKPINDFLESVKNQFARNYNYYYEQATHAVEQSLAEATKHPTEIDVLQQASLYLLDTMQNTLPFEIYPMMKARLYSPYQLFILGISKATPKPATLLESNHSLWKKAAPPQRSSLNPEHSKTEISMPQQPKKRAVSFTVSSSYLITKSPLLPDLQAPLPALRKYAHTFTK